jgi:Pyruvate/2-oxoacid:ferredoxin oxidoreductase gamma subunit
MEREIMWTGIGGQGVQLGAQVLARAAVLEGREVLLFGSYGGVMRGGNTDSTLVVADQPISSPPVVARTWAAVAMHHAFFKPVREKLYDGSLVLLNESLFEGEIDRDRHRVFAVPATAIATDLGSALAASMVLTGAFAGLTEIVGVDSLVEAMRTSLPSYRQQHADLNEEALRAGFGALPPDGVPAWKAERAA